jgi:6-phosphogluconate dehydrogenase (decarboxylating)
MQLGMIGLGRMGGNMVRRLLKRGHQCVVYNRSANAVSVLVKEKAVGTVQQNTSSLSLRSGWAATETALMSRPTVGGPDTELGRRC